jgi:8-oxoguanine deaminase
LFDCHALIKQASNIPGMTRAGTARPVPTGSILLKHIQLLATHSSDLGEISDAAVYIKGNMIQWVGPTAELPADSQMADLVLDMKYRVVMPGMVNTHHHMFQALTRCIAQEDLLFGWLTALYGGWKYLKVLVSDS